MYYVTWALQARIREISEVIREKIGEPVYVNAGRWFRSLILLKLLSDKCDESIGRPRDRNECGREGQGSPLKVDVLVPKHTHWADFKMTMESLLEEVDRAARCIQDVNESVVGDSFHHDIRGYLDTQPPMDESIIRILVHCISELDLGERNLKHQQVGPGHFMYNPIEPIAIPLKEVSGIFMEHLRILSPNSVRPLWRYMKLGRFEDLMEQQSLYFARADQLGDTFEGLQPGINACAGAIGLRREFTFVNCWSQADQESNTMWHTYGGSNDCVAIETDYDSLKRSIKDTRSSIYVGKVKYVDYETIAERIGWRASWDWEWGSLSLFFTKRLEFSSESEVRAVIQYPVPDDTDAIPPDDRGIRVPVDLQRLIKRVVVNPEADSVLVERIRSTLRSKGLRDTVDNSTLSRQPYTGQIRPVLVTQDATEVRGDAPGG